ncbi:MAG: hypothetical protein Kow0042_27460 [Calditrichia bacterium]
MKTYSFMCFILTALMGIGLSCSTKPASDIEQLYPGSFEISVENATTLARLDQAVMLNVDRIREKHPVFNPQAFVVLSGEEELPAQAVDRNVDGEFDQIVVLADFAPQEVKRLTVRFASSGKIQRDYRKRTQAELSHKVGGRFVNGKYEGGEFQNVDYLRVPPEHTDHSEFIRYEGPGWESDKVGYRFYLDWRNAIDIFGKKTPEMVLHTVGLDGFDSYHKMADWGMDILKVGESLGIGSIGMWFEGKAQRVAVMDSVTCRIMADGPLYSQIRTQYFGWEVGGKKYDLTSDLSIAAGSRLTRHEAQTTGTPPNLCTGIVKHSEAKLLTPTQEENGWTYLATYGKQSLAEDNLGMAILFKATDLIEIQEDSQSHVVVLRPSEGKLEYYFLAAWEKEPGGIQNESQFVQYLKEMIAVLDSPLSVRF